MGEVCFEIEGKCLFLDEVLVEFNIPIFFICQDDDSQKYAVLCVDSDELVYIIGKVDIKDILLMLSSETTLRAFFQAITEKWRVYTGEEYCGDEVNRISAFREDELPTEGAYFELSNSKIERYIKKLNEERGLLQYNRNWQNVSLLYFLPQQVREVNIKDNYIFNPIKYTIENHEIGYTSWHCKSNRKSNFPKIDTLMLVCNSEAYFNKEVAIRG